MSIRNWFIRARLAWNESRHTAERAFRPTAPASLPNTVQLEDRVMLSISPGPVMADGDVSQVEGDSDLLVAATAGTEQTDAIDADRASTDDVRTAADGLALLDSLADEVMLATEQDTSVQEIVFVDLSVADVEQLLDDLWQQRGAGRELEIVQLDPQRDGLAQITDVLSERDGLDAVHFLSHAAEGTLKLGNTWLNSETVTAYADTIGTWGDSLSADADLLFYGCNLAASAEGRSLVANIGNWTGADVAASTDLTGHALLGADWDLEYRAGAIETSSALSDNAQQMYGNIFGVVANQEAWTNLAANTDSAKTISTTHTVSATPGTDRLLLVAMVTRFDNDQTISVTSATFGGVQLHSIVTGSDPTTRTGVWMGYLLDSEIAAGPQTLSVTFTSTVSDPTGKKLLAATYSGVDQTTPINDAAANNSKADAPISFGSQIDYRAGGEVVYVASFGGTSNQNTTEPVGYSNIYTNELSGMLMTTISHKDDTSADGNSAGTTAVDFAGTDENHSLAVVALNPVLNVAPTIILPGGAINYTEGDGTVILDGTATVSDADSPNFDTGTLTVDFTAGGTSNDRLAINNQGPGVGNIAIVGNAVSYDSGSGPVVFGTFAGGTDGTTPLVITLNSDAGTTAVQALVRNINYENVSDDPATPARTVRFVLTDGDGGTSNAASETVNVTAVNDAPTVALVNTTATMAEDADTTGRVKMADIVISDDAQGTNDLTLGGVDAASFEIDGTELYLKAGTSLDFEIKDSYDVTVEVNDTAVGATPDDTASHSLSITDVDEFDVGAVTDSDAAADAVDENAVNGTAVGITAAASDADATTNAITYSLDDDASGRFAIHGTTGVVTVAGAIDREAAASYDITVRATSADGSSNAETFTINVNDVDEFDVGAVTDSDAGANTVAEDAGLGTVVGLTGLGSDADATTNTITYSLDADAGGRFAIHATTGVVTLNGVLDYETDTSHSVTIRAASSDGSSSTQSFTINVTDVNESAVSAISDSDASADYVLENATAGTAVGVTASADDADGTDTVSYSLDDDAGGRFAINSSTGVVTVAGTVDREAAGSYDITVRATSTDTTSSTRTFTITLGDVDEFDVGAVTDSDATANAVDENAVNGTAVGITATASDADATTNAITYSLDDDAGGRFAINSTTGVVTVNGALDYETSSGHWVTIRASSDDGSSSTLAFMIAVNPTNDNSPTITSDGGGATAAVNVTENATAVTTVTATDADLPAQILNYSIFGGADGSEFAINASTGALTFAAAPDFEIPGDANGDNIYEVTVQVSDGAGGTDTQAISVTVADTNDSPVFTSPSVFNVAENETFVTMLTATDQDVPAQTVGFSITGGADQLNFALNPTSGVLVFVSPRNFESPGDANGDNVYEVEITASDGHGGVAVQSILVSLDDQNDNTPVVTPGQNFVVAESAANGASLGNVLATDADAVGTLQNWTITFDSSGGIFAIDSNTGELTVANNSSLDYESATNYTLFVRVEDGVNTSAQESVVISVSDADEFDITPISDTNVAADAVDENAALGLAVGVTAFADDADGSDTVSYSLDDDAGGRFAIGLGSGVVTVADTIDFETGASHSITVRATSSDGSTATRAFNITINDLDEFDVSAITDTDPTDDEVAENAAIGASVGLSAFASDADGTTNAISYSLDNDAGGRFAINSSTGEVTVAGAIDREAAASYDITVRASSADSSSNTQTFTINVNDVDEFDVGTVTDNDAAANTVAENAGLGTIVGLTGLASDADATNNTISYWLDDDAGGRFAIHATTGVVTLNGALDYESASSHSVTIRATSSDGSSSTQSFTINVTDVNESPISTISDADAAADFVLENATAGTAVGVTALATDPDGSDTVSYSLDDNAGGRFAINNSTGVVTVAGTLDREAAGSYDITVRATSTDATTTTRSFTITLGDVDEFDVGTITDSDAAPNVVDENAVIGTAAGVTAAASDADATANSISYSLDADAGGRFAINSSTGVVTVAAGIDREAAASYEITVRATSADGSSNTQTFTIDINDLDEFDVGTLTDSDVGANTVAENAGPGTVVGLTGQASDADATNNAITYSLDDDAGGRFAIHAATGVVTLNGVLDYETSISHSVTIRAASSDGSTSTQSFTIDVTDVSESGVSPISDTDVAADFVLENATVGTAAGVTALATDPDGTDTVSYSLDNDAGGRFAINSSTGVVTVAGAIDREAAASYDITVRATSTDTTTTTRTFTITLGDVDEFDVGAVTDSDATPNAVDENAVIGTAVGVTADASDADATISAISYALDDDAGGRFAINSSTGVVTVAGTLDREAAASHDVTVRATSADGSSNTETFTINVNDVDEFDVGAVTDSDLTSNVVDENAVIGTAVGVTAAASDADVTTSAISYSLDDDAGGRFAINSSTGAVTVAGGIDREAAASYDITVRATSADGSSSTQTFTINVNDLDEFDVGTVTDSDATANSVAENAGLGTFVGLTGQASDADATNNAITYSLDDDAGGRFAIHAATGVVTLNGALDYEANTSHSVTVRAASSDGSSSIQSFTIGVSDVNEAAISAISDADAAADFSLENATVGSAVGVTALADDPDGSDTVSYLLDDDAGGRFAINNFTGVVTVAGTLDREAAGSYDITVRATSTDATSSTRTFTITLGDVDEFDVGTVTDSDAAANTLAENAGLGSIAGLTGLASDVDATNNTITYSLDDDAGGRFTINSSSGVVTLDAALDYETASSHLVIIRAASSDGSSSTQGFTINVTDISELGVSAISDSDVAADFVLENATAGTAVGITALADDPDGSDTVSYSLDDDAGGRFAINSTTGVVTVAGAIDREAAASYDVTVRATSTDTTSSTRTFTITLGDVDEFDVGAVTDSDATANAVAENAVIGTGVGVTAEASDADATTSAISYSLDDDAGGRFAINSTTGVVTVAGAIDREAAASYDITVRATSADGSDNAETFTINVNDVDEFDVGAVTDSDATANAVAENAGLGTVVGLTGLASDADATNSTISYWLDDDAGGRFAIHATTGIVTVNGTLDYEAASSHSVTIRAASSDGSSSSQSFTINVTDVNESGISAISDSDAAADYVLENAAVGTAVGMTALATDPDGSDTVSYWLDDDAGGRFAIDSTSGVVTVNGALDREAAGSYDITVRATSTDTTSATRTFTIALGDVDEFDVGAIADSDASSNTVNENAVAGTGVGVTALASDADGTDTVSYMLDDDAGARFAIDAVTGVVTTTGPLDAESATSHSITVRATSTDGTSTTRVFSIVVNPLNDNAPTITSDGGGATASISVAEGTTAVTTVMAADADLPVQSLNYTISGGADAVKFAINNTTGELSFVAPPDFEAPTDSNGDNIYEVTVEVGDGAGGTGSQAIAVTVTNVNDAPSDVSLLGSSVDENVPNGTVIGTASATDPDVGESFTYMLTDDAAGRFAIDAANGQVSVFDGSRLDFENAASYNVTIRVTDAGGLSRSEVFTIDVNDVNEMPTGPGESYVTFQMESISISSPGVLANDHDVDGDSLTAVLLSGTAHGSLIFNSDGSFTYTPDDAFAGADSFTYAATDGALNSPPITVTINVEGITAPAGGDEPSPPNESPEEEAVDDPAGDILPTDEQTSPGISTTDEVSSLNQGAETISPGPQVSSLALDDELDAVQGDEAITAKDQGPLLLARRTLQTIRSVTDPVTVNDVSPPAPELITMVSATPLSLFGHASDRSAEAGVDPGVSVREIVLGTTTVVSTALSVGYVVWLIRGGTLFASMVASLPAWTLVDPLPILTSFQETNPSEQDDEERLCDLVR